MTSESKCDKIVASKIVERQNGTVFMKWVLFEGPFFLCEDILIIDNRIGTALGTVFEVEASETVPFVVSGANYRR